MSAATTTHAFRAEVSEVLRLVIHSLYSHKEIFLRELISNASDALDKLRVRALTEPDLLRDEKEEGFFIRIRRDKEKRTLTIEDSGVGMTEEELVENLGTVAHSGSRAFLQELARAQSGMDGAKKGDDVRLIGQFGVGFYSAYLVADRVAVRTRAAGATGGLLWTSDAKESFTIEPCEKASRGTEVILHLKPEHGEFTDDWLLRDLVRKYSDFVAHPIQLEVEDKGEKKFEVINSASALWRRAKSDITDEDYVAFYKHLTHDIEPPLAHVHFKIEGTQEFTALLYIPRRAPFDLGMGGGLKRRGVRLFARRVFVMDDCEEILPQWLRFVRGVVDSDDLPLNVSRETLQDSSALRAIKKQVVKKILDLLDELTKERPDDYAAFWAAFGVMLKEGLAADPEHKDRLAALVRFESSRGEATSLAAYVERMPEGQKAIYYLAGESKTVVSGSPYLEALRAKGYEVLWMTEPVDEFAIATLGEYKKKKFVSAMQTDLELGGEPKQAATLEDELAPLAAALKKTLGARIKDVAPSERLTDSPACLVLDRGGTPAYLEKMLREAGRSSRHSPRILEVNTTHPLILSLATRAKTGADEEELSDWFELLYDQAVLAEGGSLEDPNAFARRLAKLLTKAAGGADPRGAKPRGAEGPSAA